MGRSGIEGANTLQISFNLLVYPDGVVCISILVSFFSFSFFDANVAHAPIAS